MADIDKALKRVEEGSGLGPTTRALDEAEKKVGKNKDMFDSLF